jgi:threonine/homoserine/homoserine lactone efflux protein
MLAAVAQGILIGLGAAVPIGQVNVMIARRTLHGGFWPGFAVGAGASTIDVTYALLSAFGVGRVLANPRVSQILGYVAVVVLVYLGTQCLRAGLTVRPRKSATEPTGSAGGSSSGDVNQTDDPKNRRQSRPAPSLESLFESTPIMVDDGSDKITGRAGYVTGLAMTVFNPLTIAFWFLALPGMAMAISPTAMVPMAAGVFIGTMSWVIFFAGTLSVVRRFKSGAWMRVADIAGGITLLAFAVKTFLRSIEAHL